MMKVNILTSSNFISYFFLYPLMVNNHNIRDLGIKINFYNKIKSRIYNCDTLLLDSKYFMPLWSNRAKVFSVLEKFRIRCKNIIWMDSTASTGTTHFQVMPYVDKYWKKQLLRDLNLYMKRFYNSRIYLDYYKNEFNLNDADLYSVEPIRKDDIHKLTLSWNLCFAPYLSNKKIQNILRFVPWNIRNKLRFNYHMKLHPSTVKRSNDITFRGSNTYSNKSIAFQRLKIIEKLNMRNIDTMPLKYREYIGELKNSKIAVSPFGAGELCYRDFEIILSGSLLFKPSIEHLSTWPELFIDRETYFPFKWDMSDFDEKIDYILNNHDEIRRISNNAQNKYKFLLSKKGQEEFCQRFNNLLMGRN